MRPPGGKRLAQDRPVPGHRASGDGLLGIVVVAAVLFYAAVAAAGPVIVQDGRPLAVIVTADKPTKTAAHAAAELQHFIAKMSGATLPILTESADLPAGKARLLVGRSKLTARVKIPSGQDRDITREGFVLRTRRNTVIMAGNEDGIYHGTEYAVYELLERLGCRWFLPGEFGEVVPERKTIEIPDIKMAARPSFIVRNIWMSGWAAGTPDYAPWLLRNKGTPRGGFAFPGDGTIHRLAPYAKYGAEYPDMYAVRKDGTRQDKTTPPHMTMLCTTNPKAVEIAAASICAHLRAHPEMNSYGFSAPDGSPQCHCEKCAARNNDFYVDSGIGDSISDAYFNFVNNLAWAVNEEMPDKYIIVLAYANRVRPPERLDRPWNKNIIVQLARLRISAMRPIGTPTDYFALRHERTLKAWARIAPKMLIYDYDPHADLSRMPYWRSRAVADDMRTYKKHNVIGFTTEGQPTFFRTGLNYYIRARCMWDTGTDVDAAFDDFHEKFFGPAAVPMKKFTAEIESMLAATPDHITWQPLYADWTPTYPPDRAAALGKLLNAAEKLADTPTLKKRIAVYRMLHDYMKIHLAVFGLRHQGKYAEALAAAEKLPPIIEAAQRVQPGLLPPDPGWVLNMGRGLAHLTRFLGACADRAGGKMGKLLALGPAEGDFRPDPKNVGLYEQWYRDDVAPMVTWDTVSLTKDWGLNGHRDAEGRAYDGIGWCRFAMKVRRSSGGRAQLVVPQVFGEKIWIWVNGHLVLSPTNVSDDHKTGPVPGTAVAVYTRGSMALAVDIQDQLRPNAENSFTFRIQGSLVRTQHRGLADRPFVWARRQ